jgi:hypothetical protein
VSRPSVRLCSAGLTPEQVAEFYASEDFSTPTRSPSPATARPYNPLDDPWTREYALFHGFPPAATHRL